MTRENAHGDAVRHTNTSVPTLANAHAERSSGSRLKAIQKPVWDRARAVYRPGHEQLVYASWAFGEPDDWAGTADVLPPGRFINPNKTALLFVGFTGQPDFLKEHVPEMLAVLVPVTYEDGHLKAGKVAAVRSATSAARGDQSAEAGPYARQFNYLHERRFMHSAYSAGALYLDLLENLDASVTLPVPDLCQMVRRGGPNRDGQMPAPTPVPFGDLTDAEIGADPSPFFVLDLETVGVGPDGALPGVMVPGHVRALFTQFGANDPRIGSSPLSVWYSVR